MGNTEVKVNVIKLCPDCKTKMHFNFNQSAFTEDVDFVVIPVICPECKYTDSIYVTTGRPNILPF